MRDSFIYIFIFICITIFEICISKSTTSLSNSSENDYNGNSITSDQKSDYRRKYAQQMLSYMNHSVSPCDDFYEYACGNWENLIKKRYTDKKRQHVHDISFKYDDFIENILQKPDINDLAPQYADELEISKKFYSNCIESTLYPMQKSTEYLKVLNEIGGFPAVNSSWNADNFSWLNMSFHMMNYGIVGLMREELSARFPFPPYSEIPDFGFGIKLDYKNNITESSYVYETNYKNMHYLLSLYEVDEQRIASIIKDIFEFLNAVFNVFREFGNDRDKCYNLRKKLTVNETDEVTRLWQAYYEISWANVDLVVKLGPCTYLYKKLIDICNNQREAVGNYLSLRFLYHMHARVTDKALQKSYCLQEIKKSMKYLINNIYLQNNYDTTAMDEVTALTKQFRQSLRTILKENDWIDESLRNASLDSEKSIKEFLGQYENKTLTDRIIKEIKNLNYVNNDYETNNLNLKKFQQNMERYLSIHYKELNNNSQIIDHIMEGDAYFNIGENALYIYDSMLQAPVYNKNFPNSLKFGALGTIIGHELSHGFETDKWLSTERAHCFVDQYNEYAISEINRNINGELTKKENIADSNGLLLAMKAYLQYVNKPTKSAPLSRITLEEQMPGLDFTPDQLFFLGYAQLFCASYKETDYWNGLMDTHAFDRYRVLGPLSHNADFANAYNCSLGSKMNPSVNKCKMW